MKRLIRPVLCVSFAMANLGFTPMPRLPVAEKLLGVSPQSTERERMIIRFSSPEAMRSFRELPSGLPARFFRLLNPASRYIFADIERRFERFSMMVAELTGAEAARLARRDDVVYIEKDISYYLYEPQSGTSRYEGVTPPRSTSL